MTDFRFTPLERGEENIEFSWCPVTTENLVFKMRVSANQTSYIVAYMNKEPFKISAGNQESIIEDYNTAMNNELDFLRNARDITENEKTWYATI